MPNKVLPIRYPDRGRRIRLALAANDMSQDTLADGLNLAHSTVSQMVAGINSGEKHIKALARLLKVDEEWMRSGGSVPAVIAAACDHDFKQDAPATANLHIHRFSPDVFDLLQQLICDRLREPDLSNEQTELSRLALRELGRPKPIKNTYGAIPTGPSLPRKEPMPDDAQQYTAKSTQPTPTQHPTP